MDITTFFSTYAGRYVTQSFLHALIATVMVDMAIQAWKIDNPSARQRSRYAVILYAILSFPAYQLINPERGSVFFRLGALFDSDRWLSMEFFGLAPLRLSFLALILLTTLVFLFQELVPVLKHMFEETDENLDEGNADDEALVAQALESFPGARPDVIVLNDDDLVLFSSTGRNAAVFISSGLLRSLSREQVQAALAHEAAHMKRNRRPVLVLVFILRMMMFFNPVVLIEFRRAVRNEEKICDDIALTLTQNPRALAETLKKFRTSPGADDSGKGGALAPAKVSLEDYGHNLQLESRIARIEQGSFQRPGGAWFPFALVFVMAAVLNYFVV